MDVASILTMLSGGRTAAPTTPETGEASQNFASLLQLLRGVLPPRREDAVAEAGTPPVPAEIQASTLGADLPAATVAESTDAQLLEAPAAPAALRLTPRIEPAHAEADAPAEVPAEAPADARGSTEVAAVPDASGTSLAAPAAMPVIAANRSSSPVTATPTETPTEASPATTLAPTTTSTATATAKHTATLTTPVPNSARDGVAETAPEQLEKLEQPDVAFPSAIERETPTRAAALVEVVAHEAPASAAAGKQRHEMPARPATPEAGKGPVASAHPDEVQSDAPGVATNATTAPSAEASPENSGRPTTPRTSAAPTVSAAPERISADAPPTVIPPESPDSTPNRHAPAEARPAAAPVATNVAAELSAKERSPAANRTPVSTTPELPREIAPEAGPGADRVAASAAARAASEISRNTAEPARAPETRVQRDTPASHDVKPAPTATTVATPESERAAAKGSSDRSMTAEAIASAPGASEFARTTPVQDAAPEKAPFSALQSAPESSATPDEVPSGAPAAVEPSETTAAAEKPVNPETAAPAPAPRHTLEQAVRVVFRSIVAALNGGTTPATADASKGTPVEDVEAAGNSEDVARAEAETESETLVSAQTTPGTEDATLADALPTEPAQRTETIVAESTMPDRLPLDDAAPAEARTDRAARHADSSAGTPRSDAGRNPALQTPTRAAISWMEAVLQRPAAFHTESNGTNVLRLRIDEESGSVTLRTRHDGDRMIVSVAFTDSTMQNAAQAQSDDIRSALQQLFESAVDLSFAHSEGREQSPDGGQAGARPASATAASARPSGTAPVDAPRSRAYAGLTGARYEWVG